MASIALKAFSAYRQHADGRDLEILFGGVRVLADVAGQLSIEVGNVPYSSKLDAPGKGLVLYYGALDATSEISRRRLALRNDNQVRFCIADIQVEVGDIYPGSASINNVRNLEFVSVSRMNAVAQQSIVDLFIAYGAEPSEKDTSRIAFIARYPSYFERLLDELPEFKKLKLIVIPILDDDGKTIRHLGYLRGSTHVKIVQSPGNIQFAMPEGWDGIMPVFRARECAKQTAQDLQHSIDSSSELNGDVVRRRKSKNQELDIL